MTHSEFENILEVETAELGGQSWEWEIQRKDSE